MSRYYRRAVMGLAVVLLIIAGVLAFTENSEKVMQEKTTADSGVYSFSFVTQENEPVNTDSSKTIKDSAVRPIIDSDEVYYSDSFFERSNDDYDHELARASLALSMTAFKQEHAEAFLSDMGYDDLIFYRYEQQNDEDKVALAIGHKKGAENIIAMAVRGGKYGDEWGSNGRVGYDGQALGYHYGFHKAAEDAIVQLKEYAADNDLNLDESVIWITGFSRGAAVANVMGAMLTGQSANSYASDSAVTIPPANLFCYTFASPSTVSESNVTQVSRGLYNIVNPLDIVTRLPMNTSGTSTTSKGKTVKYSWDYVRYGTTLELPAETKSAQLQVVQLLEKALAFATRSEEQYVRNNQDQVVVPALKKAMGKGADVSKRNIGTVLVGALPGVTVFLKNEVEQLDFPAQIYIASLLSGKKSIRLEKEHWPETYWGWMVEVDGLE